VRREVLASFFAVSLTLILLTSLYDATAIPVPYAAGSSPINPGKFGTSRFVQILRELGMDVTYVSNWSTLDIAGVRGVVVVIVSPEIPYTDREARRIAELLRNSERGVLLVADEDVNSNRILEEVGTAVRVSGRRLLDEYGDLHPRAIFYVGGRSIGVRLDKASELVNCNGITVGYAESYTYPRVAMELKSVACLEVVGGITVLALSDGTLLTNQVIVLGGSYADLATAVAREVSRHCGSGCVALVESGKYLSDRALFERMLLEGRDRESVEVYLNQVLYSIKFLLEILVSNPSGLEEEFLALILTLTVLVFISVKVGLTGSKEVTTRTTPMWRGAGDLAKIRKAILDILEISGCPTEERELIPCLEGLGYSKSRELAKFLRRSEAVLRSRLLSSTPIVPLLIRKAVKYSRELVDFLEKSLGTGVEG
jgi:hypothetical protein